MNARLRLILGRTNSQQANIDQINGQVWGRGEMTCGLASWAEILRSQLYHTLILS